MFYAQSGKLSVAKGTNKEDYRAELDTALELIAALLEIPSSLKVRNRRMKTKMKNFETYSLNLSERYASNWTAYEVAREVVCNAIDATPNYSVEYPTPNSLRVHTDTVADVTQLFVIGEGTKVIGGETIGQFGEGIKLAALVSQRDGKGMTVTTPSQIITFNFEQVGNSRILFAKVEENPEKDFEGMEIFVEMTNIQDLSKHLLFPHGLDNFGIFPVPTSEMPRRSRFYCRGIYICESPSLEGVGDINFNNMQVNRDRNMSNSTAHQHEFLEFLMDSFLAAPKLLGAFRKLHKQVVDAEKFKFENSCFFYSWGIGSEKKEQLKEKWFREVGENAVIASNTDSINVVARLNGKTLCEFGGEVNTFLARIGLPTAADFAEVTPVEVCPTQEQEEMIQTLRTLGDSIEKDRAEEQSRDYIVLITNSAYQFHGLYSRTFGETPIIWLKQELFKKENFEKLVGTYLHELAHHLSEAGDCTEEFEEELTDQLGILGAQLLRQ